MSVNHQAVNDLQFFLKIRKVYNHIVSHKLPPNCKPQDSSVFGSLKLCFEIKITPKTKDFGVLLWLQDKITTRSKTPKLMPCFINILIIALFTDSVNRFQENNCKKVQEISLSLEPFYFYASFLLSSSSA